MLQNILLICLSVHAVLTTLFLVRLALRKNREDQERDNAIHDLANALKELLSDRLPKHGPPPPPADRVIVEGKAPRPPHKP